MNEMAAFPHKQDRREPVGSNMFAVIPGDHPGMSLRDYFAAKAMAALIGTSGGPCIVGALGGAEDEVAKGAYKIADAMLKARAQSTPTVGTED